MSTSDIPRGDGLCASVRNGVIDDAINAYSIDIGNNRINMSTPWETIGNHPASSDIAISNQGNLGRVNIAAQDTKFNDLGMASPRGISHGSIPITGASLGTVIDEVAIPAQCSVSHRDIPVISAVLRADLNNLTVPALGGGRHCRIPVSCVIADAKFEKFAVAASRGGCHGCIPMTGAPQNSTISRWPPSAADAMAQFHCLAPLFAHSSTILRYPFLAAIVSTSLIVNPILKTMSPWRISATRERAKIHIAVSAASSGVVATKGAPMISRRIKLRTSFAGIGAKSPAGWLFRISVTNL